MTTPLQNPFRVEFPEKLSPNDAIDLFVDVFSDFHKIIERGHTFIHGPRGSGKSMMFRYMRPDCQSMVNKSGITQIDFFSIYIPLKNTSLNISDLGRISSTHGELNINEHLMVLYFVIEAIDAIQRFALSDGRSPNGAFYQEMKSLLDQTYGEGSPVPETPTKFRDEAELIASLRKFFDALFREALQFIRRLPFSTVPGSPPGPLLGYIDFFHPFLLALKKLDGMPDAPIYLLIDDADNFSIAQTRILNTWVSSRTSDTVSIKVSTQMEYKTFQTSTGRSIDATHDFSEINISDIYTSSKGRYLQRLTEIVNKRLKKYGVVAKDGRALTAYDFFPLNDKQEKGIAKIADELRSNHEVSGRGFRPSDDAVRYARPIYMTRLAGSKKASSKYSYAGFEQLAHVSSGIVRHFLEPAAYMFNEVVALGDAGPIRQIPHSVQDSVIRVDSYNFRFSEIEKMRDDSDLDEESLDKVEMLGNLIEVLGAVFRKCLLTESRSERRVFSIALYDEPDKALRSVLKFGVKTGYLHRSTIGKKDGSGRTRLYILSRRLAPAFNLDPNGFVGYLWMSSETLKAALTHPSILLNRIKSGKFTVAESDRDQLELFE